MQDFSRAFQPLTSPQLEDPHPLLAEARRQQPVFFSEVFQSWVVTRYEDIYAILQDTRRFSSVGNIAVRRELLTPQARAMLSEGDYQDPPLVNDDPPAHSHWRTIFNKLFAPRVIASLEPLIRSISEELVRGMLDEGRADMVSRFAYPLPMRIILAWMGIPQEMMDTVKRWSDAWIQLLFAPLPPEQQLTCAREVLTFQEYIAGLISERMAQPRDDGMSELATRLTDGVQASPRELAGMLSGTLVAGNETTTSMLGFALRLLLEQPERWQLLREQPELIPQAVEEVLRVESPFLGLSRVTTEPVEVGGVALPAGARVLVAFASGNRDAARFAEPERFDPLRQNVQQHLAFGKGVHVCVGAGLARLEGRVALEVLTQRLPRPRLVAGEPFVFVPGLLRQHARLWVEWAPVAR
jgi:cytochrome P450